MIYASAFVTDIYDRMPVILEAKDFEYWGAWRNRGAAVLASKPLTSANHDKLSPRNNSWVESTYIVTTI